VTDEVAHKSSVPKRLKASPQISQINADQQKVSREFCESTGINAREKARGRLARRALRFRSIKLSRLATDWSGLERSDKNKDLRLSAKICGETS
jgi:hypothetical protein